MKCADVVLPLPLAETYTYALPATFQEEVQVGCRLIVPFGVKKIYSAIVVAIHEVPPSSVRLKEAIELLDEHPVLLPKQLNLWRWIADYYLCTLGEVYKAAMPSGMKLESESVVVYNPDFDSSLSLTEGERWLLTIMEERQEQKLADLQKVSASAGEKGKGVLRLIKSLLAKGGVTMKEEVKRTYRPRTINCVRLTEEFLSEERLRLLHEELGRSPRQQELLSRYLTLSEASASLRLQNRQLLVEVEKQSLMANQSEAAFRALRDRGVIEVYQKEVLRVGTNADLISLSSQLSPLSEAQQRAKDEIDAHLRQRNVCLLHGVTSSGKTEVYIHLIQEAIERGEQVLYLLPEIVLTAQLVERLRKVFGERLGVYHSKYPDAERVEVWQKQLSAQPYDIIVGVRSSVFLPFHRLGLVIVDEEHETSFKQQEPAPRYHARNVALVLAQMYGAKSILGTATPSLESYYNAQQGKYGLVSLTERYGKVRLPQIQVVDIAEQRRKKMMSGPFSPDLLKAMREALERHEQIILFQNRRGFAPQMACHDCGWTPRCTNCDVTLTLHKGTRHMTCHYCGATYPIPVQCPNCESHELHGMGYGTERIEDNIKEILPQARVTRMDLDTTRSRAAYEHIISDFQHGRTDILVGTQMVTKGLDFERVSVVGILNADTMMNMPDFRSYERSFQMMTQVAGRAGRRNAQGLVILQTRMPKESVIHQIIHNDYTALYIGQMEERKAFNYPPFCRLIYIYLKHKDERIIMSLANDAARLLRQVFGSRVLGPDSPSVSRVQQFHIRKLLLKLELQAPLAEARHRLRQVQSHLLAQPQYRSALVYYDVDPV